MVPRVSVLERFHCTGFLLLCKLSVACRLGLLNSNGALSTKLDIKKMGVVSFVFCSAKVRVFCIIDCTCMRMCVRVFNRVCVYLNGGGVDVKLLEDGEGLFEEFIANADVSNVWSIIVV